MSKKETDPGTRVEYYDWSRWLPALTSVAFVLALAVMIARATAGDFLRNPFDVVPGSDAAPHTGLPNTTLWIDLLAMLPALLILLRRGLDRTYVLRFTPAHALFLALAAMAMFSTLWSADRFAAAVGGFHFFAAAALCWAGTQLVRSWQRLRVVAGACAGVLAVITLHGIFYRTVELPDLQRMVAREKPQILAERGWTEDSFAWKQFERKIAVGEMLGPFTSPNTNAAMIVLLGVIVCALAAQRIRDRDEPIWPTLLLLSVAASLYVLYFTGTRAAIVTPVLAIALILVGWKFGARLGRYSKLTFFAGCAVAAIGIAAMVGHGLYHGTLFHDSLTFRWRYWVGSFGVFSDHAWAGVGYANFGYSYLAHRLPAASEEIKDPHNLFVRAFVELGVVGGLLMLGLVVRLAWEITRPHSPPAPAKPAGARLGLIFAVSLVGTLLHAFVSIDFARDPGYVATELLRRLVILGLLLLAMAIGSVRSAKAVTLDDRPAPLLLVGMVAALAVFLVHNLIDFALFEPGPMLCFAFVAGALIGTRGESLAGRRKWNRSAVAVAGGAVCAWLVAMIAFVVPMTDAESKAQRGDDLLRGSIQRPPRPREAAAAYKAAFDMAPVGNADYAYRAARALIIDGTDPAETELWLSQAVAANPRDPGYRQTRAAFALAQPPERQNPNQLLADLQAAIALDPMSLPSRIRLAEVYDQLGNRQQASEQYQRVLELNDLLDKAEPKRLPSTEVDRLRSLSSATQPS